MFYLAGATVFFFKELQISGVGEGIEEVHILVLIKIFFLTSPFTHPWVSALCPLETHLSTVLSVMILKPMPHLSTPPMSRPLDRDRSLLDSLSASSSVPPLFHLSLQRVPSTAKEKQPHWLTTPLMPYLPSLQPFRCLR